MSKNNDIIGGVGPYHRNKVGGAPKKGKKESLKAKHLQFIKHYVATGKVGESAKAVGLAPVTGTNLLKRDDVQAEISKELEANSKTLRVRHQDMLKTLKRWYNSDITQTIGLTPEQVKKLPEDFRKLITKYKHKKTRHSNGDLVETIELEFVSKEKAVEMVAKHIGFFREESVINQTNVQINNLSDTTLDELLNAMEIK